MLAEVHDDALLRWLSSSCDWLRAHHGDALQGTRLSRQGFTLAVAEALPSEGDLENALRTLRGARPIGEVALILPNNVETAILRPLFWSILGRNNTRVKLPSQGASFAQLVLDALRQSDALLARSLSSFQVDRHDSASLDAFLLGAEAAHVFGRDETVHAVRQRMHDRVVAHGSGLGLVVLPRGDVKPEVATRIALDVVRHDQRGCLSPHAVLVEDGSTEDALAWADALHIALTQLDHDVPRGLLSAHEAQAERGWRDVAAATADVFATTSHAVSVEETLPPRDCPGLRNLAVHAMKTSALDAFVHSLGVHLKCVGALNEGHAAELRGRFLEASDVVPVGRMQTPRFDAPMDGRPAHTGFALF